MSECDFLEFVYPPIVGAVVDVVGVVVRRENTAENTSENTAVAAAAAAVVVGSKIGNIYCSQEAVRSSAVAY
jgi:hypothetical protein